MKITEMTNDQASDAMLMLTEPFANICNDDELLAALEKITALGEEKEPLIKVVGKVLPTFVRLAFATHRKDLYQIVSALTMTPVGKVGGMNFKATLDAVKDSYDEILASFFPSSVRPMKKAENASAES